MFFIKFKSIFLIISFFSSFPTLHAQNKPDTSKIAFSLKDFTEDGMRINATKREGYINYEFCIPGNDETLKEVMSIDSTVGAYKTSKGRSGCSDSEWLCIGSSHQKNFKRVILELTKLNYTRKISETFWE